MSFIAFVTRLLCHSLRACCCCCLPDSWSFVLHMNETNRHKNAFILRSNYYHYKAICSTQRTKTIECESELRLNGKEMNWQINAMKLQIGELCCKLQIFLKIIIEKRVLMPLQRYMLWKEFRFYRWWWPIHSFLSSFDGTVRCFVVVVYESNIKTEIQFIHQIKDTYVCI